MNNMVSSNNTRELDRTSRNVNSSLHNIQENEKVDEKSFISRVRKDKEYRVKFLYTTLILFLHLILGWKHAQIGPSLLDLQHITSTQLDEISAVFSADGVGYLLGSLLSGFLFRKLNSAILFIISSFVSAIITIAIPFCSIFEVMMAVFVLKGIFDSLVESVSNAELFRIWKTENNIFVSTLHFCYTFGASMSPLVIARYLLPTNRNELTGVKNATCNQSSIFNDTTNYNRSSEECLWIQEGIKISDDESRLYIPYIITGALYIVLALFFFYSLLKLDVKFFQRNKKDIKEKKSFKKPPLKISVGKYTIIASLAFAYIVFECSLTDFLPMFCVEQLKWTKTSASYFVSLHWGTFALGRFLSIFCLRFLHSSILLGITSSMLVVALIGFLISAFNSFNPGLWISVALSGLVISPMFPSIFTWTNDVLLPVNGFVASLIFTFIALGAVLNPIILSYLMDNVDKMAFCYIILSTAILFLIVFTMGSLFSTTVRHSNTITLDIAISENGNKGTIQNTEISVIENQVS